MPVEPRSRRFIGPSLPRLKKPKKKARHLSHEFLHTLKRGREKRHDFSSVITRAVKSSAAGLMPFYDRPNAPAVQCNTEESRRSSPPTVAKVWTCVWTDIQFIKKYIYISNH
jgi:hypothetical protein